MAPLSCKSDGFSMTYCRWVRPIGVLAFLLQAPAMAQSDAVDIGPIAPFNLTALDGSTVTISAKEDGGITVVCFLGTECPLARLYAPRLAELAAQFAPHGVRFVGIDSNCQDSAEDVQRFVAEFRLPFPVAKDRDNVVADKFHAQRMCEVFVLDDALRIRYHGRIDDRYRPGIARTITTVRDDLADRAGRIARGQARQRAGDRSRRLFDWESKAGRRKREIHVLPRRRQDPAGELRRVSSGRRNRAVRPDRLRRSRRLGRHDGRGDRRRPDAALACESGARSIRQRAPHVRRG